MTRETPEKIEQASHISVQQASEMFVVLFENKENQWVVAKLFEWLPWLARQEQIKQTIQIARWWLEDLKNTIV